MSRRVVTLDDFEAAAKSRMTEVAYEYVASGAGDERTLRANRTSFDRIGLLPDLPRDVSTIHTAITLFGEHHPAPILLAPTAYHQLSHPQGELETVRGANECDCTLIASSFATVAFEAVQAVAKRPQWFQLYIHPDRGLTRELVHYVQEKGCAAICLTIDLPVNPTRDREARIGFNLPAGMGRADLSRFGDASQTAPDSVYGHDLYSTIRAADLTWKDIEWLRSVVKVPLLLKGVLRGTTAVTARQSGCDGVIVSNHGGRAFDSAPATIDVLAGIVDSVAGSMPVLVDGGIRRGIDMVKALALGADAILIGRPYVYGLAVDGAAGVAAVIRTLRLELEVAMAMLGCSTLTDLKRTHLI